MILSDIYKNNELAISFEIFPPKGEGLLYEQKLKDLFVELNELKKHNPKMISVTYGAGGSTREKTFDLVVKIKKELDVVTMPHFTCVNFNRAQILEYVKKIEAYGIKNILALRGDPPRGAEDFVAPIDGFAHANELVEFIKANTDLSVEVAGYPEKHPQAVDFQTDLFNLKRKVEAGADVIFTQMFFDNEDYYRFVDLLRGLNITIPVIPGIMIIQSIAQIDKIVQLSGSKLPVAFKEKLMDNSNNPEYIKKLGIEYSIEQIKDLKKHNVAGLHLYSLNKAEAVCQVLDNV